MKPHKTTSLNLPRHITEALKPAMNRSLAVIRALEMASREPKILAAALEKRLSVEVLNEGMEVVKASYSLSPAAVAQARQLSGLLRLSMNETVCLALEAQGEKLPSLGGVLNV